MRVLVLIGMSVFAAAAGAACRSTPATPAAPAVSADAWATVDGREIKRDEVEKTFRRLGDPAQALSDEETLTAKLNILDEMIMQDILIARGRELKVEVPDSDVDTAFNQAKEGIPDSQFQQELTRRNLTAADMRDGLRRELLSRKVIEQEVSSAVAVTDQDVTDFFNANRASFNLPEEAFRLAQIVVTPGRDGQVANRSGDDATSPQAAAAKVQLIMERLKGGAAFGDVARDLSEDPESAPRGGDLGLVPMSALKQAPPPLRDAVLKAAPGNARVAAIDGMYTIVYVVAREPAGQRDLSTPGVRDQITQALRGRKEQLMRTAYLTKARTDADVVNLLARKVVEGKGKLANP